MAAETPQMSLGAQLKSYPAAFWFANFMEMIERMAYYGVRMALPLYIVGAAATGGLEFNHEQKGDIFGWWAIIASFLPMFTGGYADRYGYKKTIGIAIILKIVGYGLMATQREYAGFFAGCMMLAAGTGLFKPGVQGLIAHSVSGRNASVGWGVFYELVNVGAWLAGFVVLIRDTSWSWNGLFIFNTCLVAVNFLPLLMFKEPTVDRPPPHANPLLFFKEFFVILVSSVWNLVRQPRLVIFVLIFSGFWFSFHQLFDLLPNFIDDWVHAGAMPGWFKLKSGEIAAEQFVNMNSFTIMILMIPVAYLASKAKPLTAICMGIVLAIVGILVSGTTQVGWVCLGGVIIFTFGEMLSSPRTNDYLASLAPMHQKALYLGYAQVPSGLGWWAGSKFAGTFYEHNGDKVNFARKWLEAEGGMTAEGVKAIPKEKVMETIAAKMQVSIPEATDRLWTLYNPSAIWYWIAGVGVVSLVLMVIYAVVMERLDAGRPDMHLVPGVGPGADAQPQAGQTELAVDEQDITNKP